MYGDVDDNGDNGTTDDTYVTDYTDYTEVLMIPQGEPSTAPERVEGGGQPVLSFEQVLYLYF